MAEAERIELPRPIKVITVFKTDKHASLAHLRKRVVDCDTGILFVPLAVICSQGTAWKHGVTMTLRNWLACMVPPHDFRINNPA
jgi:hypothetical protein